MRQKLFIPHQFPSLNELIGAMNHNRFAGAKMKKEWTELSAMYFKQIKPYDTPIKLSFIWFEPNAKRDPDNIVSAKKFILDGMVLAGVVPNDTQKWIRGFNSERWMVVQDKNRVGVEITIQEGTSQL